MTFFVFFLVGMLFLHFRQNDAFRLFFFHPNDTPPRFRQPFSGQAIISAFKKSIEAGVACLRKGDPSMDQIVRVDGKASVKRIPNKDHLAVQLSTHCNIFRNRKKYDRAAEKDRLVKDGTEF